MSTSIVYYSGNLRTESAHLESGENYITDAPTDNEGKGQAFSPTDLIATGLANCMLTIMGIVARRESLEIEGTRAEVTKIMGTSPRCISEIKIDFQQGPALEILLKKQKSKMKRIHLTAI